MERFVKGDVVVFSFPFSDFSESKKRPALVIANLEGDDLIVCQISRSRYDKYAIPLGERDFAQGSLKQNSFLRPNRLFTVANSLIHYKVGSLKKDKFNEMFEKLIQILRG